MGRGAVRIIADTNLLVRMFVEDDARQTELAQWEFRRAETIIISLVALCEFARVLSRTYKVAPSRVATSIRGLLETGNVIVDRTSAEAGLSVLAASGDFADGVIAHEGLAMGGEVFVSFDRRALQAVRAQGRPAREPADPAR